MGLTSIVRLAVTPSPISQMRWPFHADMASFTVIAHICKSCIEKAFFFVSTKFFSNNFSNNECSVCESKLTANSDCIQFRPSERNGEENMKLQMFGITASLNELKSLLLEQKQEQIKTSQLVKWVKLEFKYFKAFMCFNSRNLTEQLQAKDEKILELQREIYEMKLERVESLKKDLQEKLNSLAWQLPTIFTRRLIYVILSWHTNVKFFNQILLNDLNKDFFTKRSNAFWPAREGIRDRAACRWEPSRSSRRIAPLAMCRCASARRWSGRSVREPPVSVAQFPSRCRWN